MKWRTGRDYPRRPAAGVTDQTRMTPRAGRRKSLHAASCAGVLSKQAGSNR